jgi:Primase C terminal 1 (PriCT-1)
MRLCLAQCQCPVVFNAAGHLLWHGVDPDVVLEFLLAWNRVRCRPPLDEAEIAQVVANIVRLHFALLLKR